MDVLIMDMGSDVKGESNLTDFKDKMELLSFSHGVAMQITGDVSNSERTSGKPNHQDMTVTKYLDAASPVLNQSCCEGKPFPQVDIIINTWVANYVLLNDNASQASKASYPLREARVDVFDIPGKPGCYKATVFLRPHFQLEELTASIRLVAELPPPAAA